MITSNLNILVGHSGQIPAGAISTIVKILNFTVIVCHLGGPFSVVSRKKKTINYSHVTHVIRFCCSYNVKVVEIDQAAGFAEIKTNLFIVITVFRILCKLGLSHALTQLLKLNVVKKRLLLFIVVKYSNNHVFSFFPRCSHL